MTQQPGKSPPKVSVIGAGRVGAALAYTLVVERVAGSVVLVDRNKDLASGETRDIQHALPFIAPTTVTEGDYADCRGSDVVVITAGAAQKAGESRLSLAGRNVDIFREIVPRLVEVAESAVILIVSNPVDILTYATLRISGLPWQRVLGSGTVLDTARFRYELSANCRVDPRDVQAYILGEHGDSEVPVWSMANVAGVPFRKYCHVCERHCPQEDLDRIFERVRDAAYEIIRLKGATYFAIAMGAARMIEAILRGQNTVVTASVLLQGQHGIKDICLSLPVVLGAGGVQKVIEMPLAPAEEEALRRSADTLHEVRSGIPFLGP